MEILINYKKKIASRFIPIEGANALTDIPESDEYIFSEKLEGHIAFIIVDHEVNIYNRSATKLDLPHITAAFPKDQTGIWAGELYQNSPRSRSFHVASAIANDKNSLKFAIFDVVHELEKPFEERMAMIQKIPENDIIHQMQWKKASSRKELLSHYNDLIEKGSEGMVVHNSIGVIYKLKPVAELDVAVLGYSLKEDGPGIRALLVGVYDGEQWIIVGSVGGGFTDEARIEWADKLQSIETDADIVLVAKNRLAYKWVTPTIVIQIKCIEVINEDSSGIIRKDKLIFDTNGYTSLGKTNGVSLISPVFLGIRDDKTPSIEDTGINQISSRVEILKDENTETSSQIASKIIFRQVYTKVSKTGTAVRKFVGLKTNRTIDQKFSPYVLYQTDFSAGRKEPLQTEINIAATEEILELLLLQAIEEKVKKGWEKLLY
jgi:ATP-dependent DNA ligase